MILKNKIKKIIDAIKDTDINEIEISSFWGAQKIKMSKNTSTKNNIIDKSELNKKDININLSDNVPNEVAISDDLPKLDTINDEEVTNYTEIKAPLVGTFYISPKPGEPAFINIGDTIVSGQPICIIEAMKIFNEIESEYSGKILEILIEDGQPVEYDQVLFRLKEE